MKKFVVLGVGLCWAMVAGAAELSVDFTFSANDISLIPAGDYTVIELADGTRPVDEVGAPAIPAKYANILLPAGAQNVKISASGDWTLLAQDITPYPAQPRSPKSKPRPAFVPANARYASAEAWPAEVATYQGDQDMQGYRFVSVRVNPLAYVGAEKKLYFREKVTVTATYDVAAATTRTISSKQKSEFEPLVNSLVVNPSDASAFAPAVRTSAPKATVDYLIITSSALSNAFQQIANYRASAAGGSYTTRVLTTNTIASDYSGADMQIKIRACISNAVATMGTTMVLLGGDDTIVPVRYCSVAVTSQDTYETNMPTDLYYSGLGGSWNSDGDSIYGETTDNVDLAWDVVVARLPMRTATQVTNYLNKVTAYEAGSPVTNKIILGGPYAWDTYTGTDRPSDSVLDGHAGYRATSPTNHASVSDSEAWLRRLYKNGIYSNWPATVGLICDTITSWDTTTNCGSYVQSEANTKTAFNKNWTHLMFSGHGEPLGWGLESGEFYNTDAASMTGMVAFIYTDACLTGHFDKNSDLIEGSTYTTEPCLAESFLRNANTLGGALAYMGCARYGWGEPDAAPASNTADGGPSTVYAYKFYKRMYETAGRTLGVAFAMHKADMASLCGSDAEERWIQFGVNLLGDPALKMPVGASVLSAPVFGANPGPVSATSGVEMAFTVSASGNPVPTLALKSTTATSGYSFAAGTGQLNFTPPAAGSPTFTFTASNSQGMATQTVSVTVSAAPPAAPASIWASATNATDFTAAWSSVVNATNYRLDVATNSSFSGGGGAGGTLLSEGFDAGTTAPSGWTFTTIDTTYTSAGNYGTASPGLKLDATGDRVQTPALSSPTNVSFWIRGNSTSNSSLLVEGASGGSWSTVTNLTHPLPTVGTAISCPLGTSVTNLRFTYTKSAGNLAFDDVVVTGGGGAPSYVSGYSNRTVAGTSQSVTGLVSGATYYFRARAVSAGGTSSNSSVASVTTVVSATAPVFGANPGPVSTTTGVAVAFTVSATGNPTPTLALKSTTASNGTYSFTAGTGSLSYTPPVADAGTRTFTFTASNSVSMVTQIVSVVVSNVPATAPVFGSNPGPVSTTTGVAVAFTVSATGIPTPTLALQSTTAASGYSFTAGTGQLNYTPPEADAGTKTFTFTASNSAGVATQTVSVAVTAGIPSAPASIWASATNSTDFTAGWSSVSVATSYRLDVATNSSFSGGGGGGGTLIDEDFTDFSDWTDGGTASDTDSGHYGAGSPCRALGSNDTLTSPAVDYPTQMTFYVDASSGGNNKTTTNYYSLDGGSSWLPIGIYTSTTVGATITQVLTSSPNLSGSTNVKFRFVSAYNTWYLDDVKVTCGSGSAPSYIPGYSNRTVAGTSQSVTGLVSGATYYFRARAVSAGGTSSNSSVASVTTVGGASAPSFTSGTGPYSTTTDVAVAFTVSASGNPLPTLALKSTTAPSGYSFTAGTGELSYTPPLADVGARTFTFTASNSAGVATQTVSVTVSVAGGGGMETFANYTNSSGSYVSGTFTGQDGSTWTYALARGDLSLNGKAPTIQNKTSAYIQSGTISGGMGTLQLKYRKPFTTALNCSVYVNDILAGSITGGDGTTQTWSSATLNIAGDVMMVFSNKSTSGQITLDDISWTGYAGGGSVGTPPTVNAIGMQSVMAGKTLNTTVTATQTDGDPILYYACSSTVNAARWTFNTNSGAFSFTPTTNEVGSPQFNFTATDKDGASETVAMSVTVSAQPAMVNFDPPTNGGTIASATIATEAGRTYALQYTTSLTNIPQVWIQAGPSVEGTGDALPLQDTNTLGSTQRFYRVVIP